MLSINVQKAKYTHAMNKKSWMEALLKHTKTRMQCVSEGGRADCNDFALHIAVAEAAESKDLCKLVRIVVVYLQSLEIGDLFDDGVFNGKLAIR